MTHQECGEARNACACHGRPQVRTLFGREEQQNAAPKADGDPRKKAALLDFLRDTRGKPAGPETETSGASKTEGWTARERGGPRRGPSPRSVLRPRHRLDLVR